MTTIEALKLALSQINKNVHHNTLEITYFYFDGHDFNLIIKGGYSLGVPNTKPLKEIAFDLEDDLRYFGEDNIWK